MTRVPWLQLVQGLCVVVLTLLTFVVKWTADTLHEVQQRQVEIYRLEGQDRNDIAHETHDRETQNSLLANQLERLTELLTHATTH